ncbi:C40 family peptidase [Deinococcus yavapaiensis]|uniref:Cell wall-associated NlpC family hydrolase n=1 Tax=Deinococcus yavapaiensis KR-236 TaxID=694435 RepID=A0A318SBQ9_9DEIO|nr:C40 family peptidase [Deinococcus yavapaiensis]PYE56231.1 cell wall-associated NlpC family hydrolase [Deinococcus yavapaiensis KR-236]
MRRAALLLVLLSNSALFSAATASRVEYRVVAGDTAYSLARRFGVTVDALLAQNGLKAPDLKVGQTLLVESSESASTTPPPTAPSPTPLAPPPASAPTPSAPASPAATTDPYTVAAGDTLFSLARARGLKVEDVMRFNNLTSPDLQVGQVLQFTPGAAPSPTGSPAPESSSAPTVSSATPAPAPSAPSAARALNVVDNAMKFLGVPYVYGGTTPRGLDCSGLVLQVMTPLGVSLPRTSAAMFRSGEKVDRDEIETGDLVFFDTEGAGQVTHVGIAIDADTFVHANSYNGKVTVDKLAEKYYATRFLGARRVLLPVIAAGH